MAPLEGMRHRDLVGILNIAAGGHPGGDPRDPDAERAKGARNPTRRRFTFEGGAGREDDFVDVAALNALDQGTRAQLVGSHSMQR